MEMLVEDHRQTAGYVETRPAPTGEESFGVPFGSSSQLPEHM